MGNDGIHIAGEWPAWGPEVRHGVLEPDGRAQPVLLRTIDAAGEGDLGSLKAEVQRLSRLEDPGLLRLLDVVMLASQPTRVYEMVDACSVARLMESGLPMRVVVELGAAVADVLASVQGGVPGETDQLVHPGATPRDVLVDARGDVRVLGFRRTAGGDERNWGSPPGYGAPEGVTGSVRSTYGLGALLVEMVAGAPPASTDGGLEAHETVIGTAVAAVRRRRGDAVSDDLLVLLGRCLEGAPRDRPSLADAGSILRDLARGLEGPDLRRWAGRAVVQAFAQDGLTIPVAGGVPGVGSAAPAGAAGTVAMPAAAGLQPFDLPREDTAEARPTTVQLGRVPPGGALLEPMLAPDETEEAWPVGSGGLGALSPAGEGMSGEGERSVEVAQSSHSAPVRVGSDAAPGRGRSWALLVGAGLLVGSLVGVLLLDGTVPQVPLEATPQTRAATLVPRPEASATDAGAPREVVPEAVPDVAATPASGAPAAATPASDSPAVSAQGLPGAGRSGGAAVGGASEPDARGAEGAGGRAPKPAGPVAARAVAGTAPAPPPSSAGAPPLVAADADGSFEVRFQVADPSVTAVEVRCHRGRGDGTDEVVLTDAGPGPCKVTGRRSGPSLVAVVTLSGPSTYRCFENGARSCR